MQTSEVQNSTSNLAAMSEAMQTVISSMMILSTLNMFTGGGLGRFGGKMMGKAGKGFGGIGLGKRAALRQNLSKAAVRHRTAIMGT